MRELSQNQEAHLQRIGTVVDHLELMAEAGRRAIDAQAGAARELNAQIELLDRDIEFAQRTNNSARAAQFTARRSKLQTRKESLQEGSQQAQARLGEVIRYLAPWRSLLDRMLEHVGVARSELGIAQGGRSASRQADIVIGGRR